MIGEEVMRIASVIHRHPHAFGGLWGFKAMLEALGIGLGMAALATLAWVLFWEWARSFGASYPGPM